MKKLVSLILVSALVVAFAGQAFAVMALTKDPSGDSIQAFIPDPAKSQAPITGTYVFKKGSGGSLDITGWKVILIRASADVTYYYNSDSTKLKTVPAGSDELIFVGQDSVTQVTVTLGAATAQIQGM